jgi:hypothetical protein
MTMSWLSLPFEVFRWPNSQELIADGRIRDLVVEFDRLRKGTTRLTFNAKQQAAGSKIATWIPSTF